MSSEKVQMGQLVKKANKNSHTIRHGMTEEQRLAQAELMLQDRMKGLTMQELGDKYGMHRKTAEKRIDMALEARVVPTVDKYRKIEGERITNLMRIQWEQIELGNEIITAGRDEGSLNKQVEGSQIKARAVDGLRSLSAQFSKLNGLNAPEQVVAHVVTETKDSVEQRLIDEMNALNAAKAQVIEGEVVESDIKPYVSNEVTAEAGVEVEHPES